MSHLKKNIEERNKTIEILVNRNNELINEKQKLQKENAALDKQKEYLKKQGDECAITVSNLVIENKTLKDDNYNFRLANTQCLKAIEELKQNRDYYKKLWEELTNDHVILKEQLRATVENAALQQERDAFEEACNFKLKVISDLSNQIDELNLQVNQLKRKLKAGEGE